MLGAVVRSVIVIRLFNLKNRRVNTFNGISDHIMLAQLIDIDDNVNHVISITGC